MHYVDGQGRTDPPHPATARRELAGRNRTRAGVSRHGRARPGRLGCEAHRIQRGDGSAHPRMAEISWTAEAERWLNDIYEYIAADNPDAAARIVQSIYDRAQDLRRFPHLARATPYRRDMCASCFTSITESPISSKRMGISTSSAS